MTLYINTILDDKFKVALLQGDNEIALFGRGKLREGSRLISLVDKLLKDNNVKWSKIAKIKVADSGGTFSSLRLGVLTANALAYGKQKEIVADSGNKPIKLKNFELLSPVYSSEPNIGIVKKKIIT